MTTLSDIRTKLRKDLHDTDAGAYRWTDSQLDRHIERAVGEVSQAIPAEKSATLATTAGSRDLSVSSLTGLLAVDAVEFPTGDFPPAYVPFSLWGTTLTLDVDTEPTGQNAKVFYTARHTLDGSGTTLTAQLEDVVATGAAAYAALELANYLIDKVNSAGDEVSERYGAWGRSWMMAYRELIRVQARRGSVRPRRLFVPA